MCCVYVRPADGSDPFSLSPVRVFAPSFDYILIIVIVIFLNAVHAFRRHY